MIVYYPCNCCHLLLFVSEIMFDVTCTVADWLDRLPSNTEYEFESPLRRLLCRDLEQVLRS